MSYESSILKMSGVRCDLLRCPTPNPQAYVYSNAGHANSVLLHKFRERGLAASEGADDSIGWFEWSAEPGAEITDKEAWYQSNPSLGHTVHEDNIKDSLSDREDIFALKFSANLFR
jgi:hypothetical protein